MTFFICPADFCGMAGKLVAFAFRVVLVAELDDVCLRADLPAVVGAAEGKGGVVRPSADPV